MILSTLSRQKTALRPCRATVLVCSVSCVPHETSITDQCLPQSQRSSYTPKTTRRRVHNVPQLTHDEPFKYDGIGRVFTPKAFDIAWYQYQGHLVQRLNEMTAGTYTLPKASLEYLDN